MSSNRSKRAAAFKIEETADIGSEAVPKKKLKAGSHVSSAIDSFKVRWHFEEKVGSWKCFDTITQEKITSAYNCGEEQYELDGCDFAIAFSKPERKTLKTGYRKRVRIALETDEDGWISWSWEDARKKRHYYSVESAISMENNKSDNTELNVTSEGKSYTVNVAEMKHAGKFNMYRETAEAEDLATKLDDELSISTNKYASKMADTIKTEVNKIAPEEKFERTIVVTGKAPVDQECVSKLGKAQVFYEGSDVWDCMLNQTNLQNNNNKYYLIQLLKDNNANVYNVWMRWGRVGKKGQTSMTACGPNLDEAKQVFCRKFKDKTKNDWADRKHFCKVAGKYDLLEMDYSANSATEADETDTGEIQNAMDVPVSKLDMRLQELIKLMCDVKAMEETVIEMKYDAKKAPLGKLTKAQIKAGYSALKTIESLIKQEDFGRKLTQACNDFYTRIPHDFGMRPPERIVSMESLKQKLTLIEALGDIEIAVKILETGNRDMNPVDRHYLSLDCELKPMNTTDKMYKVIKQYLLETHAKTHNHYKIEIIDIFECNKESVSSDISNRMLLWHGSRLTNWVGILAKGLRVAPPEAPVTGYMFGKGIYFADISSKSANYCFATRQRNIGLLLLSEVALGNQNELLEADYEAHKLPAGKHSVKGCGSVAPDASTHINTDDGVVVPIGKPKDTGVKNPRGYTLNYNEYIVYNSSQVRMRYLLKVKFNFN